MSRKQDPSSAPVNSRVSKTLGTYRADGQETGENQGVGAGNELKRLEEILWQIVTIRTKGSAARHRVTAA